MEKNTAIVDLNDYLDLVHTKTNYIMKLESSEVIEEEYKRLLNDKIEQLDLINNLMERIIMTLFDENYIKQVKSKEIRAAYLNYELADKFTNLLNTGDYDDYIFKVLKIDKGNNNE